MKKLFLFILLSISISINAQNLDLKKISAQSTLSFKKELSLNKNLINLKIDSVKTEKVSKISLFAILGQYYSVKMSQLNDYIKEEQIKANSLPRDEKIKRLDELHDMLINSDYSEKSSVLLDKLGKDFSDTPFIIVTTINYYVNLKQEREGNFEEYFFYDLKGKKIDDIYKYIVLQ